MAYIPKSHLKYNLLPSCREDQREVFIYPSEYLHESDDIIGIEESIVPYGYKSYEEYYSFLDSLIKTYNHIDNISQKINKLKNNIEIFNKKENWAIAKYIGESTESTFGLTKNQYYYWPCSSEQPGYIYVIDDEEFTAYLYSYNPTLWQIVEDPIGIAKYAKVK